MVVTETGVLVPGITARFVETPEDKSVKTKAKHHWIHIDKNHTH